MTQLRLTRAAGRRRPICPDCAAAMRLLGVEAHPTIHHADLRTYVCSRCEGLQTEIEPHEKSKLAPFGRTVMSVEGTLFADRGFDDETTRLLGATFDAAWKSVEASDGLFADQSYALSVREVLAKIIISMVQQGEKHPDRLVESALFRLRHSA